MKESIKQLYSAIIKKHNEAPYHFEKKAALRIIKAYNPICGDRYEIFVASNRTLKELHFHGFGCAISKASTSVMTKALEGKTRKEAMELCSLFLRFLRKELSINETLHPGDWLAFAGVHDFPERFECAALSWQAMQQYLADENGKRGKTKKKLK